ncbi:MAG: hypothetical protein ACXWRE_14280 [Pseudobdellovibrionaceae bacterium]
MGSVIRFYVWVIKIALVLSAIDGLKEATLAMAGRAAKAQQDMISYSNFSRLLTPSKGQ